MRPEITQAMELLSSNDPGQIDEAIGLLQSTVYSFSMKVCGHREDAEDTMQEVLFKSIPYLAKIEDPRAMAVWLYTVTQNQCRTSRRKSKFAPAQTMTLDSLMPDAAEISLLLADSRPNPEASAISHEGDRLLHQAVLRIPPKYRLVLVLHDMEDLETEEIARITSLKEGTVRVRLHRARLLVRKELARSKSGAPTKNRKRVAQKQRTQECREMFANLSEYLDQRVDNLTCDQMQKHIADCPPCVAFIQDLERAVQRCRNFSVSCSPATAETVRRLLAQEYSRLIAGAAAKPV
jgi:RNA polymerase sigma-70 factor, ECF subfamily